MAATNQSLHITSCQIPEIGKRVLLRLFLSRVPAGFPSPADDYVERTIDLNEWLVKNKIATFIVSVEGDSMSLEFHSGDTLIVDRSLEPKHNDVVIACVDGEVTVKRLVIEGGKRFLVPESPDHPIIELNGDQELIIWGVVTYSIHKVR
jgi:DNA polymerase V